MRYIWILPLMILMSLAGCQSGEDEPEMTINMQVENVSDEETNLIITIRDAEGNPLNDVIVEAEFGALTEQSSIGDSGVFTIPVSWDLGEDWTMTIRATREDNTTVSREFEAREVLETAACAPVEEVAAGDDAECEVELPTQSPFALPGTGQ